MRRCKTAPPSPLTDALLVPASAPYERLVAAGFSVAARDPADRDEQWRLDSAEARRRLKEAGCCIAYQNPVTDNGAAALRGLSGTPRQKDILNIAFLSTCQRLGLDPASPEAAAAARSGDPGGLGLLVDISQSVNRHPWTLGRLHTVTTSTKAYSFALERVLAPEEVLMMYGWPRPMAEAPHSIGRSRMRNLVGETMALPTIGAAIAAVLVAASE